MPKYRLFKTTKWNKIYIVIYNMFSLVKYLICIVSQLFLAVQDSG